MNLFLQLLFLAKELYGNNMDGLRRIFSYSSLEEEICWYS